LDLNAPEAFMAPLTTMTALLPAGHFPLRYVDFMLSRAACTEARGFEESVPPPKFFPPAETYQVGSGSAGLVPGTPGVTGAAGLVPGTPGVPGAPGTLEVPGEPGLGTTGGEELEVEFFPILENTEWSQLVTKNTVQTAAVTAKMKKQNLCVIFITNLCFLQY
jgi:hypothetical protein